MLTSRIWKWITFGVNYGENESEVDRSIGTTRKCSAVSFMFSFCFYLIFNFTFLVFNFPIFREKMLFNWVHFTSRGLWRGVLTFQCNWALFNIAFLAESRLGNMCETTKFREKLRDLLTDLIRGENMTQYVTFVRVKALLALMENVQKKIRFQNEKKAEATSQQGLPRRQKRGKFFDMLLCSRLLVLSAFFVIFWFIFWFSQIIHWFCGVTSFYIYDLCQLVFIWDF